jgi:D-alanine transaminase
LSRVAYVNGIYVPHDQAVVPMDDRGYHFADGVYEVFSYNVNHVFVDAGPHFERLRASLAALNIPFSLSNHSLLIIMHELMRRNRCQEGFLYLQITRGIAAREHTVVQALEPFMTLFIRPHVFKKDPPLLSVFTQPDIRWKRNDIKSIALLGNIMAKYGSFEQGGDEAWLINKDGFITEGSSTNAWIVDQHGVIRTHPGTRDILNGIVRQRLLKMVASLGFALEERAFTLDDALKAQEAFLTSSTKGVYPIVSINDHPVGKGGMGPITQSLQQAYWFFQHSLLQDDGKE